MTVGITADTVELPAYDITTGPGGGNIVIGQNILCQSFPRCNVLLEQKKYE